MEQVKETVAGTFALAAKTPRVRWTLFWSCRDWSRSFESAWQADAVAQRPHAWRSLLPRGSSPVGSCRTSRFPRMLTGKHAATWSSRSGWADFPAQRTSLRQAKAGARPDRTQVAELWWAWRI